MLEKHDAVVLILNFYSSHIAGVSTYSQLLSTLKAANEAKVLHVFFEILPLVSGYFGNPEVVE